MAPRTYPKKPGGQRGRTLELGVRGWASTEAAALRIQDKESNEQERGNGTCLQRTRTLRAWRMSGSAVWAESERIAECFNELI